MIMVVTFRVELRERLVEQLRQCGYAVTVPPHRTDVENEIDRTRPQVIVLDMYLADPSALDVLRRIRRGGFRGKVIALTGTSLKTVMGHAHEIGLDCVISGADLSSPWVDVGPVITAVHAAMKRAPQAQSA